MNTLELPRRLFPKESIARSHLIEVLSVAVTEGADRVSWESGTQDVRLFRLNKNSGTLPIATRQLRRMGDEVRRLTAGSGSGFPVAGEFGFLVESCEIPIALSIREVDGEECTRQLQKSTWKVLTKGGETRCFPV